MSMARRVVQQNPSTHQLESVKFGRVVLGAGFVGVVASVLVGCGRSGEEASSRPLPVEVEAVTLAPFQQSVEAVATLDSDQVVKVASQVNARVERLLVRQGQQVRQGQLLVVLDQAQLRAEVASLRAQMLSDQRNDERYAQLVAQGAASAIQRDQYRQAFIASRQALIARQADLGFRHIKAPVAGVIGEINLRPGDVLQVGVPLTQLVSNTRLHAEIELPATLLGQLRLGLPVQLSVPGQGGAVLNSQISALEPSVISGSQLLMARAPITNPRGVLRNGLRLRARVVLQSQEQLSVPFAAITRLAGQSFVFVVGTRRELEQRPGRADLSALKGLPPTAAVALQVPVSLGPLQQSRYPVLRGLQKGQRVISSGLLNLRHGMPIQPV